MIKPNALKKGDKIAIVSLSWGGLGDEKLIHKYYIAKERLEKVIYMGEDKHIVKRFLEGNVIEKPFA